MRLLSTLVITVISCFCCTAIVSAAEPSDAMALLAPGPEHEEMARMAGDWDVAVSMFMAPDQPPVQSKGSATFAVINEGRHLQQHYKGDMMGQPFVGVGIEGFDRATGVWTSVWMDNMSTSTMVFRGKSDEQGVVTQTGENYCPQRGKVCRFKSVMTPIDADSFRLVMFSGPDESEHKMMELVYTRTKK